MLLLIDIGNSRLKWRLHKDHSVLARGDYPLVANTPTVTAFINGSSDDLFTQWLQHGMQGPQCRIVYSSVDGEPINRALELWAQTQQVSCQRVSSQPQWQDLRNGYQEPSRLGVDRWLAMVAVRHLYQGAACVIDCGTATTADYISVQGEHEGGFIMPRQKLMQDSLLQNTAYISMSQQVMSKNGVLGSNTEEAVINGASFMHQANLKNLIQSAQADKRRVFLTGGASYLGADLAAVYYFPELVIDGLLLVAADYC